MQIILVHPRLTKARSVTLKPHYLVGLAVFFVVSVIAAGYALLLVLSSYFPYLALRAGIASTPGVSAMPAQDQYVRENIATMAVKVGEMQAHIMRLDALGERVKGAGWHSPGNLPFRREAGAVARRRPRLPVLQMAI